MEPIFFFSYAHADRVLCEGPPGADGKRPNYLDELFDELCKRVSAMVAQPKEQVGYRDRDRLAIGDPWSEALADNLCCSRVLVPLLTPNFLSDKNNSCGREFHVFIQRYEMLRQQEAINNPGPLRILPIFWENEDYCWRKATKSARELLKKFHYKQEGLPDDYPQLGLHQLRRTRTPQEYDSFIFAITPRIVELAEVNPPLPQLQLQEEDDFESLPSAFRRLDQEEAQPPGSAQVASIADVTPAVVVAPAEPVPGLSNPAGGMP